MFIRKSYPGVESDAVSALRVLDQLITSRLASSDQIAALVTSNDYLSQTELSIYRLAILGLVDDYWVSYDPKLHLEVTLSLSNSLDSRTGLADIKQKIQARFAEHKVHFGTGVNIRTINMGH